MSEQILKKLLKHAEDQAKSSAETQKCINKLDKKLDLHIQEFKFELKNLKEEDQVQNKLLKEHMAGVNTLKDMRSDDLKAADERFSKLEENKKFLKKLKSILIGVGAVAATLVGIAKVFKLF